MNDCISTSPTSLMALRMTVRKESITTRPASASVTCLMIFLEDGVQILLEHDVGQVDKADILAHSGFVEEGILLLIAQHFQDGLAADAEINRRFGVVWHWRR